ncbi:hypothetical protein [Mycolicibacter virginiensis]|uniref:hypothetical protein n=1 Tax=Mycolicibacter virginiensis TaxID=1795032 RepID=UPI001F042915|nr:hypothetical protein [Mycolicibacter virginiensis]ULP48061.1 hypothetical protein MJO54_02495 [Mycolicibacter virginiensis]
MGRRKLPTPSGIAYAQALQPLNTIAQSAVGSTRWDAVVAAVVALRSAKESMAMTERRLLGLAVLSGGPIGEIATLTGVAPSTLASQLEGTDARLLGERLVRDAAGQWVIA